MSNAWPLMLAAVAAATLALEQASKAAALRALAAGPRRLAHGVRLVLTHNRRGGLLGLPDAWAAALALGAVAAIALLAMVAAPLTPLRAVGLGLMLGGAAGNLLDRFARGAVIDFISLGRWWPTFNLADVALCVGLGLGAVSLL